MDLFSDCAYDRSWLDLGMEKNRYAAVGDVEDGAVQRRGDPLVQSGQNVADDADHLVTRRWEALGSLSLHLEIEEDALADWIFSREECFGHRLADHDASLSWVFRIEADAILTG